MVCYGTVPPSQKMHQSPNLQSLWLWSYLQRETLYKCNHVRMRSYWNTVCPDPTWLVFLWKEKRPDNRHSRGEHQTETAAETELLKLQVHGHQRLPANLQRPGKGERIIPSRFQRDRGLANTLMLDVLPPELWDKTFLLFEAIQFVVTYLIAEALGN